MHLTNHVRDTIRANMLTHRFKANRLARAKEQYALAQSAYTALYSAKLRKKIDALPRGWLPEHVQIELCVGGQRHRLHFGALDNDSRRFKDVDANWNEGKITLEASHKVANALRKWLGKCERLRELEREYAGEIRAALRTIRTLSQLRKKWPEAMPFVPADLVSQANVPAIPMRALNRKLGLTA